MKLNLDIHVKEGKIMTIYMYLIEVTEIGITPVVSYTNFLITLI